MALLAAVTAFPAAAQGVKSFGCDSGERIAVSFEGRRALLSDPQGASFRLRQRPAGSGFAYEGQGHALRGKGDLLAWTPPGLTQRECHVIGVAEAAGPGFRLEGDALVHVESGMRFPATVAGFTRDDVRTYGDGEYVAVGYSSPLPGGRVHARISLIHLEGMTAAEHYAAMKPGILRRLPGARVVSEGPFTPARFPAATGYRGAFTGARAAAAETVGLTTVGFGRWSARLRTIYPTASAARAEPMIQSLIDGFDLAPLTGATAAAAADPLAGTRWRLAAFRSMDDAQGVTRPADPARYTVEFRDGRAAFRLDCNRATGGYSATAAGPTGGALSFQPAAMTRAMCPPGSWDTRIARDLDRVRSFTLQNGRLHMALEADGGIYEWERDTA